MDARCHMPPQPHRMATTHTQYNPNRVKEKDSVEGNIAIRFWWVRQRAKQQSSLQIEKEKGTKKGHSASTLSIARFSIICKRPRSRFSSGSCPVVSGLLVVLHYLLPRAPEMAARLVIHVPFSCYTRVTLVPFLVVMDGLGDLLAMPIHQMVKYVHVSVL